MGRQRCVSGQTTPPRQLLSHHLHASSECNRATACGTCRDVGFEDILIRWHRMKGDEALWLPGTDHAAIATENVVLNQIRNEEGIQDPRETLREGGSAPKNCCLC